MFDFHSLPEDTKKRILAIEEYIMSDKIYQCFFVLLDNKHYTRIRRSLKEISRFGFHDIKSVFETSLQYGVYGVSAVHYVTLREAIHLFLIENKDQNLIPFFNCIKEDYNNGKIPNVSPV